MDGGMTAQVHIAAPQQDARGRAMGEAVALITNLLRCVLWLIKNGIYVSGFTSRRIEGRDEIVVTVAPDPSLHTLFSGEYGCYQRRPTGDPTVFNWVAIRYEGIRIEWEEICAG